VKLIAHRGNFLGKNVDCENTNEYILKALNRGLDCEIDLWRRDGILYLGHDRPKDIFDVSMLMNYSNSLWIHCKDAEVLDYLSSYDNLNIFYHNSDDRVLTSKKNIWVYPDKKLTPNSVMVKFDKVKKEDLLQDICDYSHE